MGAGTKMSPSGAKNADGVRSGAADVGSAVPGSSSEMTISGSSAKNLLQRNGGIEGHDVELGVLLHVPATIGHTGTIRSPASRVCCSASPIRIVARPRPWNAS